MDSENFTLNFHEKLKDLKEGYFEMVDEVDGEFLSAEKWLNFLREKHHIKLAAKTAKTSDSLSLTESDRVQRIENQLSTDMAHVYLMKLKLNLIKTLMILMVLVIAALLYTIHRHKKDMLPAYIKFEQESLDMGYNGAISAGTGRSNGAGN